MSEKKGILSRGGISQSHVKIIAEEKTQNLSPISPPPSPSSVFCYSCLINDKISLCNDKLSLYVLQVEVRSNIFRIKLYQRRIIIVLLNLC